MNKNKVKTTLLFWGLLLNVPMSWGAPEGNTSTPTTTPTTSPADCVDAQILSAKIISSVCWDCILPIRIAGIKWGGGSGSVPEGSTDKRVCLCYDRNNVPMAGLVTAMWEPFRLIEFQRTPGCSSILNGTKLPTVNKLKRGHLAINEHVEGQQKTMLHYHYFAYPILNMLKIFSSATCTREGMMDLDMLFMSEVDPTWNDDKLALLTSPEAIAVSNLPAIAACSAEAVTTAVSKKNIQSMFWCAGSWGSMYPLSGTYYAPKDTITNTSLLTAKVLAKLHRMGLAITTMGDGALCAASDTDFMLPKNMYKFTLMHPRPEKSKAHIIGESGLKWGMGRTIPGVGEDLIYMIWRWNECCMAKY